MVPLHNGSMIHTLDASKAEWGTIELKDHDKPEDRSYHTLSPIKVSSVAIRSGIAGPNYISERTLPPCWLSRQRPTLHSSLTRYFIPLSDMEVPCLSTRTTARRDSPRPSRFSLSPSFRWFLWLRDWRQLGCLRHPNR
jgi:hypothetical protein